MYMFLYTYNQFINNHFPFRSVESGGTQSVLGRKMDWEFMLVQLGSGLQPQT